MKHRTGYLFKRGSNFYVTWRMNGRTFTKSLRDENGKPITNKREAIEAQQKQMAPFMMADETAALQVIAGKLEGRKAELAKWQDELNPPLPINEAWTQFVASPNRPDSGEQTLYQYECQWNAFRDWVKEKYPEILILRDVSKEIANKYAGSMNDGRSANTFNKHLNLLGLVFRVLKEKAKLTNNPWEEIQRKRIVSQSRRELTVDELKKVCQSATGEMKILFALGIYTGLRLGDCATLRWGEVDLQRKFIRRIPNKTARRNPKPVSVPLHPELRGMLAKIPPEKRAEFVLPETAALYDNRSDLLTDLVQRHFRKCSINPHKAGTGCNGKRAVVEVGFHSLRHTFVSLCRESNAPLAVVESIVGHSSPAMTQHYTHVGEFAAEQAVSALPSVLGDTTPPKPNEMREVLSEIKNIAESLTGENWCEKKTAILAILTQETENNAILRRRFP